MSSGDTSEPSLVPWANFTVFYNALYFRAFDDMYGDELWKLEPDESTAIPEPTSALSTLAFGAVAVGSMFNRKHKKSLN